MAQQEQSFEKHTRWHVPYHFVLFPLLFLHLIWTAVRLYQEPGLDRAEALVLSVALLLMFLLVRINPLKAQDRLIRLEEQLRFQRLLPADLAKQASALPVSSLVSLRFASDEELEGLVREVLAGTYARPADIKRAIRKWRGDYFRV
jgi:hypothetical protein